MTCKTRIVTRCGEDGACRVYLLRSSGEVSERTVAAFPDQAQADAWVEHHARHAVAEGCEVVRRFGVLQARRKRRRIVAAAPPAEVPSGGDAKND